MCKSSPSIISALCNDARFTTVPESWTGSKLATGVTAPVRPNLISNYIQRVSARSA